MSKDIKKLLSDIQTLAIEITTKTKHDVFVDYAGHVNTINIRICYGGWVPDMYTEDLLYLSLNGPHEKFRELKSCKRTLEKLLKGVI